MKPLIYVAGPISKGDQFSNVRDGIREADTLLDGGFHVLCPHLSALHQMIKPRSYESWMDLDFGMILRCDALLRMPGESPGADREVAFATAHGIPVFDSLPELVKSRHFINSRAGKPICSLGRECPTCNA